ncbi:DUF6551 family protein [Novosphingobium sp. 9]|uniref:DUF6551 family protein n=1 Tax=Novosphingobium sp. 9 TaxID=2025349 RepID=UPI0021B69822|nr:DUF6551 family protein [Novosphingobium sp. 9]
MTALPPSWINKGSNTIPEWIKPKMVGKRDANGTFVMHTRVGDKKVQSRVLVGNIVVDRNGDLYTCHPAEARALLADLEAKESGAYGAVPEAKGIKPIRSLEAEVAPRDDDTDDISRRIRAMDLRAPESLRKSTPEAQKSAIGKVDSEQKELTRITPPGKREITTQKPQKSAVSARLVTAQSTTPKRWPVAKGNPPSVENRNPAELNLDDSYQRSTDNGASMALIKRIANGWDWRMCLPLVVSKRDDGSLWVIDGQHRLAAAKLRGDIPFLPCCVGVYGSVADEAAMFVAMNRARKPMNRLDDFHAALAASDADALEIQQLVTDAGLTVARNTAVAAWSAGDIAFTASIATTLRKHGAIIVSAALTNLAEAFPQQKMIHSGSIFLGLVKVLASPPAAFDPDRLLQALKRYTAEEWGSFLTGLRGGDTRASAIRDALMMAYEEVPETDGDQAWRGDAV